MASSSRYLEKVCCYAHPDATLTEGYQAGDMICPECGLVIGDRVFYVTADFSNENKSREDPNRGGSPGTGSASFDAFESPLNYQNRATRNRPDRSMKLAFREISMMADRLNLPTAIVDRTKCLYEQIHYGKQFKGRLKEAKVPACLYIACRQEGAARTFIEICAVCKTSRWNIGKCFKLILEALGTSVTSITSDDFTSRFCTNLGLPKTVQLAAAHIAKKAVEMSIMTGKSPITIAAAAIYMASQASDHPRSHKEVGDVTGAAPGTNRFFYELMYPEAVKLFPDDFKFTNIQRLPWI